MPTPITVSVNFIDLTGTAITGYMEAAIVSPSGVYDLYVAGTGMIAPKTITSTVGTSVSVQIWGNDVVVDAADGTNDTYYTVNLFNAVNSLVWSAAYLFTGAGPINLVGFPILNPVPAPVAPTFPVVQPPGGSNGNVQYNNGATFGGDSTFSFNATTKVVGGTIFNAATGFEVGGAASSGNYLRGNGTNFVSSLILVGDLPASYPWSSLGNAVGSLTLANGANATTFNYTSGVAWTWANLTAATNIVDQPSPALTLTGQTWVTTPGPASQTVTYTIQNANGILQFSQTAGPGPSQYPFQFNGQVLFGSSVQLAGTANIGFQNGNDGHIYTVTSVANASGALTTYTYNLVTSGAQPVPGQNITIAGFVTGANNGKFVVQNSTVTTVVVYNSSGVAETHAATATLDTNYNAPNVGQYSAQLGLISFALFPILGSSYIPNNVFESFPNAPLFVATQKGNATDAAYQRILNDGSTGNHGLEIGAIVDGSGTATVSLQLGHFNSASCAVFNVPVTVKGATPTGTTGQLSFGNTTGFGAGTPATAVTTTTKGAGSGPTTPQTIINYLQIDIAGTKYWIPLAQ